MAFQRSKGEEHGFADVWGECLPARMGLWAVRSRLPLEKGMGDRSVRREGQGQPTLEGPEKQKRGEGIQQKEAN